MDVTVDDCSGVETVPVQPLVQGAVTWTASTSMGSFSVLVTVPTVTDTVMVKSPLAW